MKLKDLLNNIEYKEIKGSININIESLSQKTDEKNTNGLFFCYKGVNFDGHNFFQVAENMGAKALVVERFLPTKTTQILVENTRKVIGKICNNFYGSPLSKLKIIGITGTNGKTTSSYIIRNIIKASKKTVGVIGTNGVYINDSFVPSILTTPDPTDLYKIFDEMVKNMVEWVVMEVSAHSLDLLKVYGIVFECSLFTNLTHDHLDYFLNFENYANAKQILFTKKYSKNSVINIDDNYGLGFYDLCDTKKISYGIMRPSDAFAINIKMDFSGSSYVVNFKDEIFEISQNLVGKFNVYNVLGCIAVCKLLDFSTRDIKEGIRSLKTVEGRFQQVIKKPFDVIVDYAHTPDGLENILKTAKSLCKGKIYCVFGCGGNRDVTKRHKMGLIATKYSNITIVTSDNPRFEKPQKIIAEITEKIMDKSKIYEIVDRQQAINFALSIATKNDVVLICGKGAEDYQDIDGVKYPFSDKEVVLKYFKKINGK